MEGFAGKSAGNIWIPVFRGMTYRGSYEHLHSPRRAKKYEFGTASLWSALMKTARRLQGSLPLPSISMFSRDYAATPPAPHSQAPLLQSAVRRCGLRYPCAGEYVKGSRGPVIKHHNLDTLLPLCKDRFHGLFLKLPAVAATDDDRCKQVDNVLHRELRIFLRIRSIVRPAAYRCIICRNANLRSLNSHLALLPHQAMM